MAQKLAPCCARQNSKISLGEADLARVARALSRRPDSPRLRAELLHAKAALAATRAMAVDHEASHAGQPVAV